MLVNKKDIEIMRKLKPGHKCIFKGNKEEQEFGFVYGKEYYIVERHESIVSFSNKKHGLTPVDFVIGDDGKYFFENWTILNMEEIEKEDVIDWEKERFSFNIEYAEKNIL